MSDTVVKYGQWTNYITRQEFEMKEERNAKGELVWRQTSREVTPELEVVTLSGGKYDGVKVEIRKGVLGIRYSPNGADAMTQWETYMRGTGDTFVAA